MRPALPLAVVAAFTSMAVVFIVRTFADAVFLANVGVEYVPHFYVAQSAALIGMSFLYTWVTRHGSLAVDAVLLLALAASSLAAPLLADTATFALALTLVTLSTLGQLAIWNAVTSVVSGRRSRTFLPRAGAAATAGAVAGGFASSGIVSVGGVAALAWTSAGLSLGTLALRVVLSRLTERPTSTAPRRPKPPSGREQARRLIWLLAVGIVIEALLAAFIDFGFKREVTDAMASQEAIGVFFALYYGVTNVVLLATQLAAASRLLETRSLRTTLALSPAVLGLVSLLWAIVPVLAIAALSRGLENVMKFAVARPAQEVAMTPLSDSARRRYKVILRGVFGPVGSALAGAILIAVAPLLASNGLVVPAVCVVLAVALALLSRTTAAHYLAALGSDLGLRQMSTTREDPETGALFDRDALAKLVDLTGSEDRAAADLARDMLAKLPGTAPLAPHVGAGNTTTRRAIYELLAKRPSTACTARLAVAVAREREPDPAETLVSGKITDAVADALAAATGAPAASVAATEAAPGAVHTPASPAAPVSALDAGLLALAAHGDTSQVSRARRIAIGDPERANALQRAAWIYLSSVRALDGDRKQHLRVLVALLGADGAAVAPACAHAIERGAIAGDAIDDAIATLVHAVRNPRETARMQALALRDADRARLGLAAAPDSTRGGTSEAVAGAIARDGAAGMATAGEASEAIARDGAAAVSDGASTLAVGTAGLSSQTTVRGGLSDLEASGTERKRQALIAAASLDRERCVELVIEEIGAGSEWAEETASQLRGGALARIAAVVLDPNTPARTQARLLGALRVNDQPEVTELALRVLAAPDLALRDQAVTLLLSRQNESEGDIPRWVIEHALDEQMARFEVYVRARPGFGSAARESQMEVRGRGGPRELSAEAFFLDELERCTERALGRLCALLALLGRPESVFDAERALRAPTFQRRRQALDVLQEVVGGRQKARLLDLLDRYLMPPRQQRDGDRDAAIAIDPWLARCANGANDSPTKRLWALRSAVLFDAIDGDSLATLADRADEIVIPANAIVVREGDAGDALYVVIDGALGVERDGAAVAQLGSGEAFGELALLDGEPRQATVRALQRSRLLRLPRDAFDRALSAHPELGLGLVLGLVKWLRQGKTTPRFARMSQTSL